MKKSLVILVVLLALAGVVVAATSVTIGGYQIDYLGHEEVGDNYAHTYRVTGVANEHELSHWSLEMCVDSLVSPDSGNYTTLTDAAYCDGFACEEAEYDVEVNGDTLKFNASGNQLDLGESHVFQILTMDDYVEPVPVTVKGGQVEEGGMIDGPVCDPTAVSLSEMQATSSNDGKFHVGTFVVMLILMMTTAYILRRRMEKRS